MGCMVSVPTGNTGIKLRFGKFVQTINPGLNFIMPCCERVDLVDMKINQSDLRCVTKTFDNVFITIMVSIQFKVSDPFRANYSKEVF